MHSAAGSATHQQQQHRRGLSLSSAIANDRDDDLSLFQDMQKRERELKVASIPEERGLQTPRTWNKSLHQPLHGSQVSSTRKKSIGSDDIFSLDGDKNDYDWLMTPPGTPLFLNLDHDLIVNGVCPATLRSSFKTCEHSELPSMGEPTSRSVRGSLNLQQQWPLNACSVPASKSASGLPMSSTPCLNSTVRPSISSCSTDTSQHTSSSANSFLKPCSTNARAGARQYDTSSGSMRPPTPPSVRLSILNTHSSCSLTRSSTPIKRPPSPNHPGNFPTTLGRCASASRASSLLSKSATLSRASSPTGKAWIPEILQGLSQEPPPNLRTSMPWRSSRGPSNGATQGESPDTTVRCRRLSSSPVLARGRTPPRLQNQGKAGQRSGKLDYGTVGLCKVIGSKVGARAKTPMSSFQEVHGPMVDSNVKKPTKSTPLRDVKSIFSSVREASGLGRNLSKKSSNLMASKHMDTKSTPHKFRSFVSNTSKPYLVNGLGPSSKASSSVTDSPMATSSSASSEHNMSIVIDPDGSDVGGDESVSEKGSRSSAASQHDLFLVSKERRINSWLCSPDYRDDEADIMQIFQQEGLESLSEPESPLFSELDGSIECENFCLDPM